MILVCYVAPSLGSTISIIAADAVLRALHYQLVWKDVIDVSSEAVEIMTFFYSSFIAFEIFLFVLLSKRELAIYFSYRDIEKKQTQMTNAFNAQNDAVIIVE